MRKFLVALSVVAIAMAVYAGSPGLRADSATTIDFEGLAEGSTIGTLSVGTGISGDPVAGTVEVLGVSPAFPGSNSAMVFDATCAGGCSGGDDDLLRPALGNVAIITEDQDASDPDDGDLLGSRFDFDFSAFGPGAVDVASIVALDVEQGEGEGGASVTLFSGGPGGVVLGTVGIPDTGNNGLITVPIGISDVDFMRVVLNGSGAIDNVQLTVKDPPPPPPCVDDNDLDKNPSHRFFVGYGKDDNDDDDDDEANKEDDDESDTDTDDEDSDSKDKSGDSSDGDSDKDSDSSDGGDTTRDVSDTCTVDESDSKDDSTDVTKDDSTDDTKDDSTDVTKDDSTDDTKDDSTDDTKDDSTDDTKDDSTDDTKRD